MGSILSKFTGSNDKFEIRYSGNFPYLGFLPRFRDLVLDLATVGAFHESAFEGSSPLEPPRSDCPIEQCVRPEPAINHPLEPEAIDCR